MINQIEKAENIEFDRAALKRTADDWIGEINNPHENNWTVQKSTDVIRLWTRKEGLSSAPDVPLV